MSKKIVMLLLAILAVTTSCVNENSDEEDSEDVRVFNFSVGYDITGIDNNSSSKATSDIGSYAKKLVFIDYVAGVKMQEKAFTSSDEDYGNMQIGLSEGTHRLVFVAHNSDVLSLAYPELSFDKVKDTFIYSKELVVNGNTNPDQSISLSRSVGKIFITATDAIPDEATGLRVIISSYHPAFDVALGATSGSPAEEVRTFTYSDANKGVKGSTYTIYCFANKEKHTTDVTIELLGAENKVLHSNKLSNVPVNKNTQTKITGSLFSFVAWSTITIESEWNDDVVYLI